MILMTHCESCIRKHACTTRIKNFNNYDFSNIVIVAHCNTLELPRGLAVGMDLEGLKLHDIFDHCNDCDFASKCKYYNHPEMIKEINRIRSLCYDHKYDNIRITCKMYHPIYKEEPAEILYIPVFPEKKTKKFNLFSRKKEENK